MQPGVPYCVRNDTGESCRTICWQQQDLRQILRHHNQLVHHRALVHPSVHKEHMRPLRKGDIRLKDTHCSQGEDLLLFQTPTSANLTKIDQTAP